MQFLKNKINPRNGIEMPDVLALLLMMAAFVGMIVIASHWFDPLTAQQKEVDLSLMSLPRASFLSIGRIILSYILSLVFTIVVGYWAAYSRIAERIMIPLIDILQSVPTLGFLPGTALFLLAMFPKSNVGLELTAILMIFASMAWNMVLSFYSSLKSIPREYKEVIETFRYSRLGVLLRLELPFSINGLAWNSMLSVAGGWFFLTICESFTLGDRSYKLIGIGSYMAYAAERGDYLAILAGVLVMITVLYIADQVIWRPLLRWAERFQRSTSTEDEAGGYGVISFFASSKRITRVIKRSRRYYSAFFSLPNTGRKSPLFSPQALFIFSILVYLGIGIFCIWGVFKTWTFIAQIPQSEWIILFRNALYSTIRVVFVVILCAIIMIPLGLWLGSKPQLMRRLQTVVQVIAGFPAPMIFPVVTSIILWFSIPMSIGCIFLMMMGAQWYLLFNVIAGTSTVPKEFVEVAQTAGMSQTQILLKVYLPAAMPQIITGLLTAAGGAWNTSIVAEIVNFRGKQYLAPGLGSYIAVAAENQKYAELIAAVGVMVVLIIMINRFFWAKLYTIAEAKYRI